VAAVIEFAALLVIGAYVANAVLRRKPLRGTVFLPYGLFLAPSTWIGRLPEIWRSR